MSMITNWVENLKWETISHTDEHSNTGELLFSQYTEEAKYRGGYLIRDIFIDYTKDNSDSGVRQQTITFIP